ncbi:MAG: CusA/CzcA family heavy metal efflux RND transporter [Bacteroidales bacterium]|nr:CusA/CzcA family heavy metal efflux RND transporter [Bacteroidales bacterium]
MFQRIINFSVNNKAIIGFLVFVLIGFGIYSMQQIPIDAVPDITNNQVQVVTVAPSLSPQEVERFITYPLEINMANITDVIEIRSISRYGLSVVTIVFKEKVPILDARQLVDEQIRLTRSDIEEGLGSPQMLPITTGLGEIYQYTLGIKKGYEGKYNAMEMREIQDWIVKRQLSGIPGIVEIGSFGGFLKQYEIAVDPQKLKSLNLTITDVFEAVSGSNENTGGSYIEKTPHAFYIRAIGLLESVTDIENIVITGNNGNPVLVKHIGKVIFGSAPRFGALTKNGKGEAVGGITMMLKGANSSKVIKEVKDRVKKIQQSLPEGIFIEPYLDRSELVKRTTSTVTKNLIEGGLIVIFILVLLLGHFRSGLIVASVIPLSMLFGFIMMHIFGVSANLMSLGAIDFGIVLDGAVIIVESILFHLNKNNAGKTLTSTEIDAEVRSSAAGIYQSASFGVIIILIVFIPVLSLTGIEGKMFHPMAQTFMFVVLGAFLLSMTYVPMMTALFLEKKIKSKKTLSDRFIKFLKLSYYPVLRFSLANKYTVLIITLVVFTVAVWSFTRLGGEFIPTLEEGDLAMQMTIPTGSSLSQSILTASRAEKILIDNFPEVEQVISKIGTAEVPTDPMAIEDADIMIVLKDKNEWVSAKNREELIDKMKEKLSVITAASFEFTQPIQLRFNELMTGVKTDIAIKIYGEDLDELYALGNEAADLIAGLPGAADVKVEQITGLPQLFITYNRERITRYGLRIADLNAIIRTAYAGEKAGVIFKGERNFDLVIRLDTAFRKVLDLESLTARLPDGSVIPLSEVAQTRSVNGPVQIARDDTRRRITVGINVRNRDIQSLVDEISEILDAKLRLKPGYYITYGGQFENLKKAEARLIVAVPIALLLILILLFFTFNSIRYALLIFTAVPLSAVGGIAALWIRGLPFSISAGVGFIALFGVAVLNGIVLLSYYNEMISQGITHINYIVIKGACTRLRPVMMTATTDILGFLPMAISSSAGAEVQRPLATVVIGGIITSTMLTLIILPILYTLINNPSERKIIFRRKRKKLPFAMLLLLLLPALADAQEKTGVALTPGDAVSIAIKNNPEIRNAELKVIKARTMKMSAWDFDPLEFTYQYGQINSTENDRYIQINQHFGSLLTRIRQCGIAKKQEEASLADLEISKRSLTARVKSAYFFWWFMHEKHRLAKEESLLFGDVERIADLRYHLGEFGELEKIMVSARAAEVQNKVSVLSDEVMIAENKLKELMVSAEDLIPPAAFIPMFQIDKPYDTAAYSNAIIASLYQKKAGLMSATLKTERSKLCPGLFAGYFYQDIYPLKGLSGWQVGFTLPILAFGQASKIKEAKIEEEIAKNYLEQMAFSSAMAIENLLAELTKYFRQLQYYNQYGLEQANEIIRNAGLQFEKENIDYLEYVQTLSQAIAIKTGYLETLNNYNQTAIQLEFYAY